MAPGFSMVGEVASLIFFSASLAVFDGDKERFGTIGIPFVGIIGAGFLRSRRDGGGGASSARP